MPHFIVGWLVQTGEAPGWSSCASLTKRWADWLYPEGFSSAFLELSLHYLALAVLMHLVSALQLRRALWDVSVSPQPLSRGFNSWQSPLNHLHVLERVESNLTVVLFTDASSKWELSPPLQPSQHLLHSSGGVFFSCPLPSRSLISTHFYYTAALWLPAIWCLHLTLSSLGQRPILIFGLMGLVVHWKR